MDSTDEVSRRRAELEHCRLSQEYRFDSLGNLAVALYERFKKEGEIDDLNEAITLLRAASELRPDHRFSSLGWLSACLSYRYVTHGVVADLEEAVTLGRAALELCPPEHPDRGVSLHNLARVLWMKIQKQVDMPQLHSAISLHQAARPTSRADLPSTLFDLSLHSWDRFQKQATLADLDEAICLVTYVLELRLPGHLDYTVSFKQLDLFVGERVRHLAQQSNSDEHALGQAVENIGAIANYFRHRSRDQRATADLSEAITLYRYVLQFRPTGHPDRASSLHDLAQCLADRFCQQRAEADVEEAIALEQEALQLLVPGDPRYDISRCSLPAYLQMKIRSQVPMMSSNISPVTHFDIEPVIRNVALESLKTLPTRLLHTHTGILCNRDAQISHFMSSQQYNQLLSMCATCNPDRRMELIHTAISRYFRFVTLSHRWGEGEPSLRDLEGQPIYPMPARGALGKLQSFCAVACEWDYLWAWSDTCCIDKDSSAEVQEAIGSMFAWYRRSALTIVYLSDVPDTGSFQSSVWFGRGWTLQELLAPKRILFYTQNWSLYKGLTSLNHKADIVVLEELERVTGIESRFLTHFCPGVDDARLKLQWASLRRTSRPEDIAYSLFGIFNLHLPVLYGESAENALGRLLAEIVSQSGDVSVLDWVGEASPFHSCFPAQIASYQKLPLPPPHPNAEDQASTSLQPTLFKTLRKLCSSLTTSLLRPPRLFTRSLTPSSIAHRVPVARLRAPGSYTPSDVYDFHSLTMAPLPRFLSHRLIVPGIAHPVTAIHLKEADPSAPSYMYKIQASGLRPLEIALPDELENQTRLQDTLQLVRPWHSGLLGPSTELDGVTQDQLLITLRRPFNALLLTRLPHNEYQRIVPFTLITAQPIDRASILKSKIRIFNIV